MTADSTVVRIGLCRPAIVLRNFTAVNGFDIQQQLPLSHRGIAISLTRSERTANACYSTQPGD